MVKHINSTSQICMKDYYKAIQKRSCLVYYAFIDEFDISKYMDILSKSEIERINKFYMVGDKTRTIVGLIVIRHILASFMKIEPNEVDILIDHFGKPYCKNYICHFNISHSNKCVAIALNNMCVGVDIEFIKSGFDWNGIANIIFSDKECKWLIQENSEQKYFMMWVCKEAIGKLIGCGLDQSILQSYDFKTIDYGLNIIKKDEIVFGNVHIVQITRDYVMAIATEKNKESIL